jgi:hypothetical protein
MLRDIFGMAVFCLSSSVPVHAASTCTEVEGMTFLSIDSLDVGLGPHGPVMGHRSVEFKDGKFRWIHSDVVESGTFICSGNRITGEYFREQGVLVWQGLKYRLP